VCGRNIQITSFKRTMIEELRTIKFFSSLFFFFFVRDREREREREIRDDACMTKYRYLKLFQFYFPFLTICPTLLA